MTKALAHAPAPRDRRALAPRRAALNALLAVFEKGADLADSLNQETRSAGLDVRDQAFARALAAGALRRIGALDAALAAVMRKPLPETALRARWVLRLGAGERLLLSTPAYAAVDAATSLMGETRADRRYQGLANAVLRRVGEAGAPAFAAADPLDNLPEWLKRRWRAAYGEASARAMAAAGAGDPPLDLSLKPEADLETWARRLEAERLPTGTLRRSRIGAVAELPGYGEGLWWAQDAAAALPARLLDPQPGERILDLCAAPGGKTLQLAAAGASVTALDRSGQRLNRLKENLARTGLAAALVEADAVTWRPEALFEAVLLDAPCTATGTLRRRPDAAWTKSEASLASLACLQAALLSAAFAMVKPGGRLVYCVCSLEPEEGERRIEAFLKAEPGARLDPIAAGVFASLDAAVAPPGVLRTRPDIWADKGGMDGFFAARIVKLS